MCWCLLIPILIGLISALLGYLLGKLLSKNDDELNALKSELAVAKSDRDKHLSFVGTLQGDVNNWKTKYETLQPELEALKSRITMVTGDDDADKTRIAKLTADLEACNAKLKAVTSDDASDKSTIAKLTADLEACNAKLKAVTSDDASDKSAIAKLQAELDACRAHSGTLNTNLLSLQNELSGLKLTTAATATIPFDAATALVVFGKKVVENDLKLVEGIGPKIEELFHAAGIKTWKALAETSVEKCKEVLETGGERFQMHDPTTWPRQSALMYEGKWAELKAWQDKLDGGKE